MKYLFLVFLTYVAAFSSLHSQTGDLNMGISINTVLYNSKDIQLDIHQREGYFEYSNTRNPDIGIHLEYGLSNNFAIGVGTRYRKTKSRAKTIVTREISMDPISEDIAEWENEFLALEIFATWRIKSKNKLRLRYSQNDPIQWQTTGGFENVGSVYFYSDYVENEIGLYSAELSRRKYQTGSPLSNAYLSIEYSRNIWSFLDIALGVEKNILFKDKVYELYTDNSAITNDLEVTTDYLGIYAGIRIDMKVIKINR